MQFIAHNIYYNILGAEASKDSGLRRDIMLDEVSKIIATEPNSVKKAMVDAGIQCQVGMKPKDIANILQSNISSNAQLRKNISTIINMKNGGDKFLNVSGSKKSKNRSSKKPKVKKMDAEALIYDSLYFSFNGADADMQDDTLAQKVKARISTINVLTGKDKVNAKKAVMYSILLTSIAWVGGYYITKWAIKKYGNSPNKISESTLNTTPSITPINTPITQPIVPNQIPNSNMMENKIQTPIL